MVTGAYVVMLSATVQQFALSLGVGLPTLGLLLAIGNRPFGLAGSVIQPFAGLYADAVGRRRVIIAGSALAILSMLAFFLAAISRSTILLAVGFFLFGLSLLGSPASQAMIAESVNLELGRMGFAFGAVYFFSQLSGVVLAPVAGIISDSLGYYLVFIIAAVLEASNLAVMVGKLKETRMEESHAGITERRRSALLREAVSLPEGFLGYFATFATDAFSFGLTSSILYAIIRTQFGFSNTEIGLIVGIWAFAIILSQFPATRLLLRIGPRMSLAVSEFFSVLLLVGWSLASSLVSFLLLSILFGISVAMWVPAQQSLLMSSAPPKQRGSVGGKLAAFRGLAAFPAPILGGVLFDSFGYKAPMVVSIIGTTIALIMILKLLPKTGGKAVALVPVDGGLPVVRVVGPAAWMADPT
jgi:DHA1 family multidrug resistance protein-like MFS transporter